MSSDSGSYSGSDSGSFDCILSSVSRGFFSTPVARFEEYWAQSPHIFTHASGVPLRLGDSPSTTDYRVEIEPVTYGLPTLPNLWWNDDLRLFEYQKDTGEHRPVLVQEPEREGEKRIWAFFHDTVPLEEQQKQTRAYLDTKGKAAERIRKIQDERPKPATPAAIRRELSKHEATSPAVGTSPLVHVVPEVGTSSLTQYSSNLATGVEKKPLEPELETQSNEPEPEPESESEPEPEPESDDAMSTTRTNTATKLEVPAPDKFKGQATDAKPFIRRLEMYYSATGNADANDQRKIAYALLLIDDNSDAFYWKKLHMDGEADAQEEGKHAFESWKDFKEAFLKAFPVYAEGDRDSIMLTTLKQGKTPTPAFIPKFRSIASRTDLSDKTLSGFFKRAIRRDLLDKAMNMEPPTTLQGWFDLVLRLDSRQIYNTNYYEGGNSGGNNHRSSYPSGRGSGRLDEPMEIDAMDQRERQRHQELGLCFGCHKPGHLLRNCPEKRLNPKFTQRNRTSPRRVPASSTHVREVTPAYVREVFQELPLEERAPLFEQMSKDF
ncbi:hypothetical protein EVJ58_g2647 [Rhodofomes roseus]|uniref:CCHC-type domain-containing protein n=1 Tax=Rhodofomes roseus TaxID=34475 RepID=A0A4Y9YRL6_9APHY|nr:hypothetical protein EVJ58_g2647 [Rhodofomes roseus]